MFINKNALRRCCVGISLSSLCSVSGMSPFKPEMNSFKSETIDAKLLEDTVDRYKEDIRAIVNICNECTVTAGIVLQAFVDNGEVAVEGLKKGEITDKFLLVSRNSYGRYNLLSGLSIAVVRRRLETLGLLKGEFPRGQKLGSSLINLLSLTSRVVEERIAELIETGVIKKDDVDEISGIDLSGVSSEIKQILPRGKLFKNFIVLLFEVHKRSGYSIVLPRVVDFVSLGRKFIALADEKSELAKKVAVLDQKRAKLVGGMRTLESNVAQIVQEKQKIEDEKIKVEDELKQIKEQLDSARKYATDGVYSSHDSVKVVKTIDSSNLNGITSSIAIEKVGVYNNEEFGLVSKKNEDKAKLLDYGTHDVYDKKTNGVYDKESQIVLTKAEIAKKATDMERENTLRQDHLLDDLRITENARGCKLTLDCRKPTGKKPKQSERIRGKAILELEGIFRYIKTIASLFVDIDYLPLNCDELLLLKFVKEDLKYVSGWKKVRPYDEIRAESSKSMIGNTLFEKLYGARLAAFSVANTVTDNMEKCQIGGATDKDSLMWQLLGAAIAGCDVEDIKKTF